MNKALAVFAVVVALLAGLCGWQLAEARAEALALDRQLAASRVREAHLGARVDSLAKAYRVDTLRLRIRDDKADHLRDSLAAVLAALAEARAHHDTVRVAALTTEALELAPAAVVAQDSARAACSLALRTCEQRIAIADSLTTIARDDRTRLEASLAAARRAQRTSTLTAALAGFGAGVLLRAILR